MINRGWSYIFSLMLAFSCETASNVTPAFRQYFMRFYGENGNQFGVDMIPLTSGNLMIAGNSYQSPSVYRMYLLIVDAEGNVLREKSLGVNQELAQDIEFIPAGPDAGNYVLLSNVRKNSNDSTAIRMTIVSPGGDSLKSYYYNLLASQVGKSVKPLNDGSFFICGNTTDTDNTENTDLGAVGLNDIEDQLVIMINPDYSVNYAKRIGGSSRGSCIKILQGAGVYYYAGFSDRLVGSESGASNYENNFEFRVFTVNPASGITNFFAGTPVLGEEMAALTRSPSGIFMAVGTQIISSIQKRIYAALINNTFSTVIGEGTIPVSTTEALEGVHVAPYGGSRFLVAANLVNAQGRSNIWLARINSEFNLDFQSVFGGTGTDDRVSRVMELPGGDIMLLGTMDLSNQRKIALIRLRPDGRFE